MIDTVGAHLCVRPRSVNKSLHNSSDNKKFFSENRLSNGSNNNSDKGNLSDDDQYESDGSGESIELEPMKKKNKMIVG